MSTVNPVGAPTGTSFYSTPAVRTPTQTMGASDYMNLLIAQLKNQDPSQPMDSSQMVQQTTQLGMLQQLTEMQQSSDQALTLQMRSTAADLVGRDVIYKGSDGMPAMGTAVSVSYAGSTPTVTIGGKSISLDDVLGVTDGSTSSGA